MSKPKILINTDFCRAKTGFGRASKELLQYLYNTGKYEIVEFACGTIRDSNVLNTVPWKAIGTIMPDKNEYESIIRVNPANKALINYGHFYIDDVIESEKPDVYIGINDIWAFAGLFEKPWWNKIKTVLHITLDSLPLLPMSIEGASKADKFTVWASFASNELHDKYNFDAEVIHGAINLKKFYKKNEDDRAKLRKYHGIPSDAEIIGFVFRNQLRKSIPNLLQAFSTIQKTRQKAMLLLHSTMFEGGESWNIPELIKQYGVDPRKVLVTHICKECGSMHVRVYEGEDKKCEHCGKDAMVSTRPGFGVTEEQLNDVYNLMDVYCHPFTSGGQEMPLQEAKAAEIVTLCTSYSCGTDSCYPHQGGFALDWKPYYEPGSNFIKASTIPESIIEKINMVLDMDKKERETIGKIGRQYVFEKYSPENVGKKWEEVIDEVLAMEKVPVENSEPSNDIDFIPDENFDDESWAKEVFLKICGVAYNKQKDAGLENMLADLKRGIPREKILETVRRSVAPHVQKKPQKTAMHALETLLDKDDEGKRLAVVLPESAGDVFMATSLLPNIAKLYKGYNIYFITKPAFFDILKGNEYIHKVIPFTNECNNQMFLTGAGAHKGFFEVALLLHANTQLVLNYLNNGQFKTQFNI